MRTKITYKEVIENYKDLEETNTTDLLRLEILEGKATEETTIFISKVDNKFISDSEGNIYISLYTK